MRTRCDRRAGGDRALVLVDAENIASVALPSEPRCAADRAELRRVWGVRAGDQVIVASSHRAARNVWWAWPAARRVVKSGADGADLALLGAVDVDDVCARFTRVVIASGDGIFADLASALTDRGAEVVVIARQGSISNRLAESASRTVMLPRLDDTILVA